MRNIILIIIISLLPGILYPATKEPLNGEGDCSPECCDARRGPSNCSIGELTCCLEQELTCPTLIDKTTTLYIERKGIGCVVDIILPANSCYKKDKVGEDITDEEAERTCPGILDELERLIHSWYEFCDQN